jgi:ABC-type branched-subunit amino acid transport system permease subunit
LQAIRENEFKAGALDFSIVLRHTLASVADAMMATPADAMLALVLRCNGPSASMPFGIMADSIQLMTVIGGMGTLYGAAPGAVLIVLAAVLPAARHGVTVRRSYRSPPVCSIRIDGCCGLACGSWRPRTVSPPGSLHGCVNRGRAATIELSSGSQ